MTVLGDLSTAALDSNDIGCPYRGLMPYFEADARFFFGRLDDTRVVVDNLRAYPTTVLFGPSGVGKSSLLRAGVVRRLRDGDDEVLRRYGARETVVVCVTHWRDDAAAVVAQAIYRGLSDATGAAAALSTHELDAESIVGFCDQHQLDLLLILDQFEEYCYYHPVDDVEQAFVSELAVLVDPRTRCNLLISIREDAVAALDRFEGYLPGLLQNNLRLDHLDDAAGREAVLRPVEELNRSIPVDGRWDVEPALVGELLDQVRAGRVKVGSLATSGLGSGVTDQGRIEAPFLQLVLTRLWEEETRRRSRSMRAATLRELGGAEQIVREHLDRVLEGATPDELAVIAAAFGYLVTPSGTKIAHTSADLALMTGTDRAVFDQVMQRLTSGDRRILRQVPPPVDDPHGEPRYEVFHDVLGLAASDWRSRYLAAREGEETERRLVAERNLARDEARDSRRRLMRARAVLAGTAVLAVACLLLALLAVQAKQESAERLSSARQNRALVEAAETGQVNPGDALERVLATYRALGAGDAAAATALRTAIDANTERLELRMGSPGTHVLLGRILSDGERLVTVSDDGHVRVWHTSDGRLLSDADVRGQLDQGTITSAEVVPDGSGVVIAADSGATALVPITRVNGASGPVRGTPDPAGPSAGPPVAIVGRQLSSWADDSYVYLAASGDAGRPLVVTFGPTRPAEVWDADGNLVLATENSAAVAALDPKGGYLASWSPEDGQVRVRDLSTGAEQAGTDVGAQWVSAMAVRSDGQVVFADTFTAGLRIWDWRADTDREVFLQARHRVDKVTWSSDEDFLLVNADKRTEVVTFDGGWRATTPPSADWAYASRLSPDGRHLAVAAGDGLVSLFQSEGVNAGAVTELRGHQGAVIDVGFSPDGREVVTAGWDGTARVWSLPEQVVLPVGTDWVLDATFSKDGRRVATITSDHIVKVFDAKGETLWEAELPWTYGGEQGVSLSFAPDGTSLVAAATDVSGPMVVRGPESVEQLDFPDEFGLASVCWSDDGDTIAAGGLGGRVGTWSADGRLRWDTQLGREAVFVACLPDGDVLVGTTDGVLEIRDEMTGEVRRTIADVPVGVRGVAASRDGDWVAAISNDLGLRVWNLDNSSGEPDLTVIGHDGTVAGLAFSGDEDGTPYVATSASDGGVRVYDVEDGSIVSVVHIHGDSVNAVEFHPVDHGVFVTAGDDGTAVVRTCDLCGVPDRGLEKVAREDLTTVRTDS